MYIQYYGLGCFRLTSTNLNILVDPFDSKVGLSAPRVSAEVVIFTDPLSKQKTDGLGSAYVVDRAGEVDIGECGIVGLPTKQGDEFRTVFWLDIGGIKIVLLGGLSEWNIDTEDVASLGSVDVLCVPVGGGSVLSTAKAVAVVRQLEPKIVIPTHFALPGLKADFESVDKFLKELGGSAESTDKLKVTLKDLPAEGMQVSYLLPSKI